METLVVSHTAALLLGNRLARMVLGDRKAAAEEQKMSRSPNQSRQPTPVGRLGSNWTPFARRGCARR